MLGIERGKGVWSSCSHRLSPSSFPHFLPLYLVSYITLYCRRCDSVRIKRTMRPSPLLLASSLYPSSPSYPLRLNLFPGYSVRGSTVWNTMYRGALCVSTVFLPLTPPNSPRICYHFVNLVVQGLGAASWRDGKGDGRGTGRGDKT